MCHVDFDCESQNMQNNWNKIYSSRSKFRNGLNFILFFHYIKVVNFCVEKLYNNKIAMLLLTNTTLF